MNEIHPSVNHSIIHAATGLLHVGLHASQIRLSMPGTLASTRLQHGIEVRHYLEVGKQSGLPFLLLAAS